jgi:hypothetical protein
MQFNADRAGVARERVGKGKLAALNASCARYRYSSLFVDGGFNPDMATDTTVSWRDCNRPYQDTGRDCGRSGQQANHRRILTWVRKFS